MSFIEWCEHEGISYDELDDYEYDELHAEYEYQMELLKEAE